MESEIELWFWSKMYAKPNLRIDVSIVYQITVDSATLCIKEVDLHEIIYLLGQQLELEVVDL